MSTQAAYTAAARQAYDAHRGGNLLSEVVSVILLLTPRGMTASGFGQNGGLLMVRRVEADRRVPAWSGDFFEHHAMTEPLLGDPGLVKAVFFADEHLMQVPDELYDREEADRWTRTLWARRDDETVLHSSVSPRGTTASSIHLITAVARPVTQLMERFFANAELMPLAIAHLLNADSALAQAQCTITDDLATGTLHSEGALLWQGTFPCTTPEDAGYQILTALSAHGLPADKLTGCLTSDAPYQIGTLQAAAKYLPGLSITSERVVTHDSDWAPVLTLLYQLRSCVS